MAASSTKKVSTVFCRYLSSWFRSASTTAVVPEVRRKKGCVLCEHNLQRFGYKDVLLLRQFLSPEGMMLPRRQTGICPKMQNRMAKRIKRSRKMGLLPNFKAASKE